MPRAKNPRASPTSCSRRGPGCSPRKAPSAVTARRLATEVGASTMAVYTHFGSMDELLVGLWRLGFARFGAALDGPSVTGDPVADWVAQGWAYRRFAHHNQHLYRVMFDDRLIASKVDERRPRGGDGHVHVPADAPAAVRGCRAVGHRRRPPGRRGRVGQRPRPRVDRAHRVLPGRATAMPRPRTSESMRRLALGFGDDPGGARPVAGGGPAAGASAGTAPPISGRSASTPRPRPSRRAEAARRPTP